MWYEYLPPSILRLTRLLHTSSDDLILGRLGPFPPFPTYYQPPYTRRAHTYVLGITGKGKSKLLEQCVVQDIEAKRGCLLIDPHSDLVSDVLQHSLSKVIISRISRKRIIYFDPTRQDYIIPFNVLNTNQDPYTVALNVVEAFRRTWPESLREAPHFSNVATAALTTLIENQLTLIDMHRLLIDKEWREQLLQRVQNPDVLAFFHERYDRWGREAPLLRESTLNKVAAFTFNPHLRRVLGQKQNHLNLRRIMDEGKVLLVDLGRCDGETRKLLGSLLVTSLEQATASRHNQPPVNRRPFYAYIDEFHDFAANSGSAKTLSHILAESRKLGVHLTLAHQTLSQLDTKLIGALGNVHTKILFGLSRKDAEVFAREAGQVNTTSIKDEPQIGWQYPLYEPLLEQWEGWTTDLQFQRERQAVVTETNGLVTPIWTRSIPQYTASLADVEAFRLASAAYHGIQISARQEEEYQIYPPTSVSPAELVQFTSILQR